MAQAQEEETSAYRVAANGVHNGEVCRIVVRGMDNNTDIDTLDKNVAPATTRACTPCSSLMRNGSRALWPTSFSGTIGSAWSRCGTYAHRQHGVVTVCTVSVAWTVVRTRLGTDYRAYLKLKHKFKHIRVNYTGTPKMRESLQRGRHIQGDINGQI